MTDIRDEILKEAQEWIGTPYLHQAKVKQVGVDCAMLIAAVAQNVGLVSKSEVMPIYSRDVIYDREDKLIQILQDFGCKEINTQDALPGDILTFRFGRCSSHLAFLLPDNYILHARMDTKKVVQHQLSGEWIKRLDKAFKLPGVN